MVFHTHPSFLDEQTVWTHSLWQAHWFSCLVQETKNEPENGNVKRFINKAFTSELTLKFTTRQAGSETRKS